MYLEILLLFLLGIYFFIKNKQTMIVPVLNVSIMFLISFIIINLMVSNNESSQNIFSEISKYITPVLSSIITAISLIVTSNNFKKTNNRTLKMDERNNILELIKFNNTILYQNKIDEKCDELLNELNTNLKSEILINRGAFELKKYLHTDNNLNYIINNLNRLDFDPDTKFDLEKQNLKKLLTSNNIADMKTLWVTINNLSASHAIQYKILDSPFKIKINEKKWQGRILKNSFYSKGTLLKDDRDILAPIIKNNSETLKTRGDFYFDEVEDYYDSTFTSYYDKIGYFFRNTHRTLKLINGLENIDEQREFIGLLRAQIPDSVMLILVYNSLYTKRGLGMARELIASDFFGDISDFTFDDQVKIKNTQHLNVKNMILPDKDCLLIFNLFTRNKNSLDLKNKIKANNILTANNNFYISNKSINFFNKSFRVLFSANIDSTDIEKYNINTDSPKNIIEKKNGLLEHSNDIIKNDLQKKIKEIFDNSILLDS